MTTTISESSVRTKRGINFSEEDYFSTDRLKLKNIPCPNCKSKGGLYRGFQSYGCFECLCYFSADEILGSFDVMTYNDAIEFKKVLK